MTQKYTLSQIGLLGLKKFYTSVFKTDKELPPCESNPDKAGQYIYEKLISNQQCMVTRFGAVEISALKNYLGVTGKTNRDICKFITGDTPQWWWNNGIKYSMMNNAGFFPISDENLIKFGDLMMKSILFIDVLGSWQRSERYFLNQFPNAQLINFVFLDPYWSKNPWTRALKGKKVLVVHPFAKLIEHQYKNKREILFENKEILPAFDLKTVEAIQSIGGNNIFKNWFDALDYMKHQIDKTDYEICLIGAGAYGLPLAAHVKEQGKKAVHIGGTLQLLFGIWGNRWNNPDYASKQLGRKGAYLSLLNENWISPGEEFRPVNYKQIENGCYW